MKCFPILLFIGVSFSSCKDNFVNHKLEFKPAGECSASTPEIQMESNVMGDRYLFDECLPDNFDGKGYAVNRKGDTLVVSFGNPENRPTAGYAVTLDIDANPRYSHILIGTRTLAIGEVQP